MTEQEHPDTEDHDPEVAELPDDVRSGHLEAAYTNPEPPAAEQPPER